MGFKHLQHNRVKVDYSYIYKITHKPTGLYYIGARYTKHLNTPPEEDFLQKYFTSSKAMQRLLVHNNINEFEWELTPWPKDTIKEEEQRLLNETADDPLCLYQHPSKIWLREDYKKMRLEKIESIPVRKSLSKSVKKLWEDPEYRAKQMANRAERKKKKKHNWTRTNKDNKRLSRQVTYGDVKECKVCKIQFTTSPRHRNYCSQPCKSRARWEK